MTRTADFGVTRFWRLVPGAIASALATQFVVVLPGLVIGNFFGETALAAFQLVSPWIFAVEFLLMLISSGTSLTYGAAMGALDRARCRLAFSSGFIAAVAIGVTLFIVSNGVACADVATRGLSPEMRTATIACWRGFAFVFLVLPLAAYLKALVCMDGDSALVATSVGTEFAVSALAMIGLGKLFGLQAALMGLALGVLAGLAVVARHFFKPTNSLKLGWAFSLREIFTGCVREFPEASANLFFAAMSFVATIIWQRTIGLASLGLVTVIFGLDAFFAENAFSNAAQPIVNVCLGERNVISARRVLRSATLFSIACGTGYCLLLELFPVQILNLYGITSPEAIALGVPSLRIAALNYPLVGLAGLLICHYQIIRRPGLSQMLVFLRFGFFPIALMVILTPHFGLYGYWFGYASMCLGGLLALWGLLALARRASGFPFFIARASGDVCVWCVEATDQGAVDVSKAVYGELRARGSSAAVIGRASVLAEEAVMSIKERNPNRRVKVEVLLRLSPSVELILRDDGRIFNLAEEAETPSSLRSFILDGMLSVTLRRDELVTTGFNRRVYSVAT